MREKKRKGQRGSGSRWEKDIGACAKKKEKQEVQTQEGKGGMLFRVFVFFLSLALTAELGLGDRRLGSIGQHLLVTRNVHTLLGQVDNLLLLNLPNLLGDLRDQSEIVRDNDDTSRELLDGPGEGIDRFHIEVVRRLVEKDDRRVLHRELGEDDSVSESVRELTDERGLMRTRETESTELRSPELFKRSNRRKRRKENPPKNSLI